MGISFAMQSYLRWSMHVDNNFPAPLQVMAFLGAAVVAGILILVTVYGFLRRKSWAKRTLLILSGGSILYFGLLFAFSQASRDVTLGRGNEKYFCEIDCHLAYSVTDVKTIGEGPSQALAVTVRTRFDESTISSRRPKDAPLTPGPREVVLMDTVGRRHFPMSSQGTSMEKELIPGQSYATTLIFPVAQVEPGMRLLITSPGGPVPLLIGNEMSLGHKKTYLAL
jgi:hypothetical protein